jgi:hypothetical protein
MVADNNGGEEIMKSALEIALEKTSHIEAKEDPRQLNEDEKQHVRDINKDYDAKTAELEIEFSQRIRELASQHGEQVLKEHLPQFDHELRTARDSINAERQEKLKAYYESIGKA